MKKLPPYARLALLQIKHGCQFLAAVTLVIAFNLFRASGLPMMPPCLGVVDTEDPINKRLLASLDKMDLRLAKIDTIEKSLGDQKAGHEEVVRIVAEVKAQQDALRKQMLSVNSKRMQRNGQVSDECARWLGAIQLLGGLNQGKLSGKSLDMAEVEVKNILGINAKAALTTSDIPMPTDFSPEIVELVYQFGDARRLCTVFPMGTLTVKLPKLTTDTAFGLIASSGAVGEKSPQIAFVTFTAEKFGGMIRLPNEIEEDSIVAMGQFLARYSARHLAEQEDLQCFMSTGADSGSNGAGKGLITQVNASNDNCLIVQASGKTAQAGANGATLQNFRDMRGISGLFAGVLRKAKYYLHPTYEALLVTFNTSATVTPYLRATPGSPPTLDGFPIEWVNVMTPLSSTASVGLTHALFGDASYQYLGLRNGVRFDISREAAFTTDEILVRALERLTVGYMATKAMAGLQTAAS